MEMNYNRLLAMLVVEAGRLDRGRLEDFWRDWQANPSESSFAEVLVQRRVITAAQLDQFESAGGAARPPRGDRPRQADDATQAHEGGGRHDEQEKTEFHASRTTDEQPNRLLTLETIDMPTQQRDRYTLTRVHGEGGLGRVWLAIDRHLNREVALKEIRPDREADGDDLRRFIREAQVTGQLEHPHIVPLYELAHQEDLGTPFYTMRFLRGRTLGDAIDDYHEKKRQGAASPMDLRRLLNFFVSICQAVAYANSRGVVHRDIKPRNIMLGDFGEVVLVDWGLAKVVGEPDDSDSQRLRLLSNDGETQYGAALGTPTFMAPEQAEGKVDLIDARTDIYGLGALLFAILTGSGPHAKLSQKSPKNTNEILKWIIESPTPQVRGVDASIPAALEAICAKAMAKKRHDRYQTASELADDVARWLADEPVSCCREPLRDRATRWMRRHRTWTQAIAASLLVVAVISIVAALVVNRARRQEASALARAESALAGEQAAKGQALGYFRDARQAVDTSFIGVSDVLQYYPGVQKLRERLLQQAVNDYQRFAEEKSDDPAIKAEFGRARVRLGDVLRLSAKSDEALNAYRSATKLFIELTTAGPAPQEFHRELARTRGRIGIVCTETDQYDEAAKAFEQAMAALEALLRDSPESAETRHLLAATLVNQSILRNKTQDAALALSLLERAQDEFESLVRSTTEPQGKADPAAPHEALDAVSAKDRAEYQAGLASTRNTIGQVLTNLQRYEDAIAILRQAKDVYERLARDEPDNPDYVQARADCSINIGNAGRLLGEDEVEELAYRDAINDFDLLIRIRPDIAVYRQRMAIARTNLAQLLRGLDRHKEAKAELDEALKALESMGGLLLEPTADYVYHVAICRLTYGLVQYALDDNTEAELSYRGALAVFENFAKQSGTPQDYQHLAICRINLGRLKTKLGEYDAAKQSFVDAITDLAKAGDSDDVRDSLAWAHTYLADLLWRKEETREAETFFRKALEIREKLDRHAEHRYNLAHLLVMCPHPDVQDFGHAAEVARRAIEQVPHNVKYWTMLGAAHYRAGDWKACIDALKEAERLGSQPNGVLLAYRAMAHWQSGQQDEAQQDFDQALKAIEATAPGRLETIELRDEAAQLLGRPAQPGNAEPEKPAKEAQSE
jgi:serine/threonine-protein kinase